MGTIIDTESLGSNEPFRGEVENRDFGGACQDRNLYVGNVDDFGGFESLGGRFADEVELTAMEATIIRAACSRKILRIRRVLCAAWVAMTSVVASCSTATACLMAKT